MKLSEYKEILCFISYFVLDNGSNPSSPVLMEKHLIEDFYNQDVFQRLPNRVFKYITYNKRVTA